MKRTVRLRMEWLLVAILIFGLGFGPVYIGAKNQEAILSVSCQDARDSRMELEATLLVLQAQELIARDLGLPIEAEIGTFIDNFDVPEVPPECVS